MTLDFSNPSSTTDSSQTISPQIGIQTTLGDNSIATIDRLGKSNGQNLLFVDSSITDIERLTQNLDNVTIVVLDANIDGIAQISNVLDRSSNVASIHVMSHGSSGNLLLGNSQLNLGNLQNYSSDLQQWRNALTEDADILFYGCNVGAGADGLAFVQQLSQITGADIAASNNLTGNAALGGDWELEVKTGTIETPTQAIADYTGTLATYTYNGKQYQLTSTAKSWEQAQAEAKSLGGNLVTINDAAEENWLKKTFGINPLWIGLTDKATEGNFQWANGETTTYRNWTSGEPNNYTFGGAVAGGEDYAVMNWSNQKQWNDLPDSYGGTFRGIIEIGTGGGKPGTLGLETSTYQIDEKSKTAKVTVLRKDGSDGTVSIDYRTVDASAKAGSDYTAVSGRLTFASGETSKSIIIPILNDALSEGSETFNLTIDNPIGNATLLAPRTATVTILDDESPTPLFAFSDFSRVDSLTLNGSASQTGTSLQLTPNQNNLSGTAFLKRPLAIDANTSFSTQFQFQLTGGTNGADGLTFVLQNSSSGLSAIGSTGGGLGYQGIGNSLAIEFDTRKNGSDSGNNQISVLRDGKIDSLRTVNATFDLNSGSSLNAWIDYNGTTNNLKVFLSNTTTKPGTASLTYPIDLAAVVGNKAYMGFTAGTSELANAQTIQNWSLTSNSNLLAAPPESSSVQKQTVVSSLVQPVAIDWTSDGSKMFIAEKNGVIKVVENGQTRSTPFIDISTQVNNADDRGLLDIAVHPDFFNGKPYIYALYVYDPPQTAQNTGLAGADGAGNRASRLTRITADPATNYTTAIAGSEVVILGKNSTWSNFNGFVNSTVDFNEPAAGILANGTNLQDFLAADSQSHAIGSVEFGKDGALYVSNGDGTSYNVADPRTVRVQDIDNLSGKILRIDPITGAGLTDNPFYNGDANSNRSKVYQYGLRNPFRMTVEPTNGKLYIGDVGWTQWEEINSASAGTNFGWPYYEGGNGTSLKTEKYQDLSQAKTFYASGKQVTAPILGLNHATEGINAIVLGDFYTGNTLSTKYNGDLFFNDLGQGIVRNISFDTTGKITSVETFDTGAQYVVQISQGPDGSLYYVDLDDGIVGRWVAAA